ncbi:MAG: S4 domain-containing protein, partial [bacterium]
MKTIITEENQGERLDKFLTSQCPEKTRSQWQKAIKSGLVLINNKKPAVHYFLKANDQIDIQAGEVKNKISKNFELAIVYE